MTNLEVAAAYIKSLLGYTDWQTRIIDYGERVSSRILYAIWQTPGLLGAPLALTQGVVGSPAVPGLSIPMAATFRTIHGDGGTTEHSSVQTFDAGYTGMLSAPFNGAGTVHVYVGAFKVPTETRAGTDAVARYSAYKWQVGRMATPDAVAIVGSNLQFTLNTAMGSLWGNSTAPREVTVWLVTAATAVTAQAIQTANATSDGTNVKVTFIGTTFGKSPASTTAADYQVFIKGLHIATSNALSSDKRYVYLGSVTGAAHTASGVTQHSGIQKLGFDSQQIAKDVYFDPAWSLDGDGNANLSEPLQRKIIRQEARWSALYATPVKPGCYLGSVANTRNWNKSGSGLTIVDSGNPTFTFADPAGYTTSWWVKSAGLVGSTFSSRIGVFLAASPLGNYMAYVAAADVETVGGPNRVEFSILFTTIAAWNGTNKSQLPLVKFDWDPGQAPGARITNVVSAPLTHYLASLHPSQTLGFSSEFTDSTSARFADLLLMPSKSSEWDAQKPSAVLHADLDTDECQVEILRYSATDVIAYAAAQRLLKLRRKTGANEVILGLFGPGGSAVDLAAAKVIRLGLGKEGSDAEVRVIGTATAGKPEWAIGSGDGTTEHLALKRAGGAQTNTLESTRPRVEVPDLRLSGADGKVVTRGITLAAYGRATTGGTANWAFDAGGTGTWKWSITSAATEGNFFSRLRIAIPHGGRPGANHAGVGVVTGDSCRLVRVRVKALVAGNGTPANNLLKAKILEIDPGTGAGATYTDKSAVSTWSGTDGGGTTATEKNIDENVTGTVDADGIATGITMSRDREYYLELWPETSAGIDSVVRTLFHVSVVYRTFELGAGAP